MEKKDANNQIASISQNQKTEKKKISFTKKKGSFSWACGSEA